MNVEDRLFFLLRVVGGVVVLRGGVEICCFPYAALCLKVNNARSRSRDSPPFTDRHDRDAARVKWNSLDILRYDTCKGDIHAFTCFNSIFPFLLKRKLQNLVYPLPDAPKRAAHAIPPIIFSVATTPDACKSTLSRFSFHVSLSYLHTSDAS